MDSIVLWIIYLMLQISQNRHPIQLLTNLLSTLVLISSAILVKVRRMILLLLTLLASNLQKKYHSRDFHNRNGNIGEISFISNFIYLRRLATLTLKALEGGVSGTIRFKNAIFSQKMAETTSPSSSFPNFLLASFSKKRRKPSPPRCPPVTSSFWQGHVIKNLIAYYSINIKSIFTKLGR